MSAPPTASLVGLPARGDATALVGKEPELPDVEVRINDFVNSVEGKICQHVQNLDGNAIDRSGPCLSTASAQGSHFKPQLIPKVPSHGDDDLDSRLRRLEDLLNTKADAEALNSHKADADDRYNKLSMAVVKVSASGRLVDSKLQELFVAAKGADARRGCRHL
eukprot:gnl/TRDRNA2_/TRDRNA2_91626_c0_seq1.p1 gnl/TRDRNA2_/TRDRNA2_91626_c0~~gnl/TRDRNA2_/TRDRNA2_91626_c0_seq1.p1  ORF type:complete len:163 (-),score=36.38 gnl/TRDRNA2_/TRDRNA2_91626_c0_seq1:8-496(-)